MNRVRRWPLFLIAAPAAVAVWSGWVGLGQLCGFGLVEPLPGIASWHLNTAITLPVGVEAYASYALGAWLTPGTPDRARMFARRSAVGALALGMLGQVVYHLLAAAHAAKAPWPVVVLVACLPVVTLGFGVALAHLLRVPGAAAESGDGAPAPDGQQAMAAAGPACPWPRPVPVMAALPESHPDPEVQPRPAPAPRAASGVHPGSASRPGRRAQPRSGRSRSRKPVTDTQAEMHFAADLAAARVPSVRRIQRELHVGQPRAKALRERMQSIVTGRQPAQ